VLQIVVYHFLTVSVLARSLCILLLSRCAQCRRGDSTTGSRLTAVHPCSNHDAGLIFSRGLGFGFSVSGVGCRVSGPVRVKGIGI
jgi:hypothetical protein